MQSARITTSARFPPDALLAQSRTMKIFGSRWLIGFAALGSICLSASLQANPLSGAASAPVRPAGACPEALKFQATPLLEEKPRSLCEYAGQVVLVVNTASRCGLTPQYESLNTLYNRYRRHGLVVLGFPANDFAGQEPGDNKQIAQFCAINYGVSFPMFGKLAQPINEHPLFAQLSKASGSAPRWNFHKYLIDRHGKVVSFESSTDPLAPSVTKAIESALAASR
jgi:glutathione peroxidase